MLCLGEPFRDREPEPGARRFAVEAKKRLEDALPGLAWNAGAIVADFDVEMAISMLHLHTDEAVLSGELDRVIDEIGEDTLGRERIAPSVGLGGIDLESNMPGFGYRAKTSFDPRQHGRKWPRFAKRDGHVELEESRDERLERLDFMQTVFDGGARRALLYESS